jgi:hypothetical protein
MTLILLREIVELPSGGGKRAGGASAAEQNNGSAR